MSLSVHPERISDEDNIDNKNEEDAEKVPQIKPWLKYFYPETMS